MLLKYVMCMLHHIVQHCDENGMDSYNLAVCIAPSLLFNVANAVQPSADLKSVFTPTSVIEYLIKNAAGVFGEDVFYLLGDPLQTSKYHLDSGTDTDSMSSRFTLHLAFCKHVHCSGRRVCVCVCVRACARVHV